ncbi:MULTISPECIES: SDR family oxidoreductase [Parafrankia]|uniref:Short-chain dehydrogenase n=1 Tax=Parafrankia soli TaxID=2599596 RepID=A0A1S1PGJ6_9ACTN|nr:MULTISPECIES: SDR family NAD(P)-dependent oxidoreductase [Parafrankia]OHV19732.1 short-chain dehydrogenase [Parafrankia soli]TCJ35992.1 SDR family NAD(P)-dependent oxidoreductase [Parafrankia sp. BMG5.11]CAI7979918.1 Short-chain dehydrogenase/reductase SDR [Frankia sp. Hr75.2]SQD99591.1 Short-chain dehydrogenase/reductase SDR [Parafrankia sp. Ea1.12]
MNLEKYGPWALVVGGSEGIGESYARKLAAQGFRLVLTARKTGPLQVLADDLRAGGAEVRILSVDLSEPDALERTRTVTDDIEVGLLIYNAGANSVRGDFVGLDPAVYRSVIAVNVLGQAEFARHYGGLMCARKRGGIILSGSGASFMGAPSLAAYCGSKAFSRIFSEALWIECEQYGVDVLHLSIGFTATPAMARLGYPLDAAQAPDEAAQEALDNIANGPLWIAGGQSSLETAVNRSTVPGRAEAVRAFATPGRF